MVTAAVLTSIYDEVVMVIAVKQYSPAFVIKLT